VRQPLTQGQLRRRARFETAIRVLEPGLNLVLAAGERLSRVVERGEDDYYPPQRGTLPPARPAERQRLRGGS
jgi:hypothetical protein